MGLLDWFRRRKKKPEAEASSIDEEKEVLERTRKLRTEIGEHVEEKPKMKKTGKKKSA